MYLPARIALSLTVSIVIFGALIVALANSHDAKVPTWMTINQIGVLTLMAGVMALPVALPNLAAAYVANRIAMGGSPLIYSAIFIVTFFPVWFLEMNLITRFIGAGTFTTRDFGGKLLPIYLVANIVICLGAAWWYGKNLNA